MMSYDFTTTTHGKWILAGEHAVLRGHPALVFPLLDKTLTLDYQSTNTPLVLHYNGQDHLEPIIWRVIDHACMLLEIPFEKRFGHLYIKNQIPLGVGLGASAALCVAVARWLHTQFNMSLNIMDFSKELEHLFHGKSSGLDIAGTAATGGIYFKQGLQTPLTLHWKPHWFLSTCGQMGITSTCIQQVQALWQENPIKAKTIDELMAHSVQQARDALEQHADPKLAEAIRQAAQCFHDWNLIPPVLSQHIHQLYEAGAIAVKPTGSGGGGHVLSLWPSDLSPAESLELMPA